MTENAGGVKGGVGTKSAPPSMEGDYGSRSNSQHVSQPEKDSSASGEIEKRVARDVKPTSAFDEQAGDRSPVSDRQGYAPEGKHPRKAESSRLLHWAKEHGIELVALVVAVAAFVISMRAQNLAQREYRDQRLLILAATAGDEGHSLHVKPVDASLTLLGGQIFVPKEIYGYTLPIPASGEVRHLGSFRLDLEAAIRKRVPPKKDATSVGEIHIPIVIDSYYAAKGQSYGDTSAYTLNVMLIVHDSGVVDETFEDMVFMKRFDSPFDRQAFVDDAVGKGGLNIFAVPP